MLKIETFNQFDGFGSGGKPGEYFYSQGMTKTQFGVTPNWNVQKVKDNADSGLSNLQLINFFAQGRFSSTDYVYGFGANGRLYRAQLFSTSWSEERTVGISSSGNGLIFDQTNRLLYANDRYLGKTSDGSSFTDNWKDFGASYETTDYRQMDLYEDWVVIANKNAVAVLNVTDDSFNSAALTLPSGYNVRAVRSSRTGVLVGLNSNNRGAVLLWEPGYDRSIAPWIWFNANIKAIVPTDEGWYVITSRGIYLTNGYSRSTVLEILPDSKKNSSGILSGVLPQGAEVIENYLVFWGGFGGYNRQLAGLYFLDLNTKLFEFSPVSNGVMYNLTGGAIFFDNSFVTHLSYTTSDPAKKIIGRLLNSNPSKAELIIGPIGQGGNDKVAEGVKLDLGLNTRQATDPTMTFDISVKVASLRKNLFSNAQTNDVSATADVLCVDGTLFKASVGDEVTILNGVNAGETRHIASITSQGTSTEKWTLDSALSNNTGNTTELRTSRFKLARKYSFSNLTELKELYFDVKNRVRGKKFLVKILYGNLGANFEPELHEGQFIYDELDGKR